MAVMLSSNLSVVMQNKKFPKIDPCGLLPEILLEVEYSSPTRALIVLPVKNALANFRDMPEAPCCLRAFRQARWSILLKAFLKSIEVNATQAHCLPET